MKFILLTKGYHTLVDDEDFDVLNKYRWHVVCDDSGQHYAARNSRKHEYDKRIKIRMHTQIMQTVLVDHIDGNGLNNQKSNLRVATYSMNNQNKRKQCNTSSKFIGVCFVPERNKWKAGISQDNANVFIGYFDEEVDAALAYDAKARELFGNNAKLNLK